MANATLGDESVKPAAAVSRLINVYALRPSSEGDGDGLVARQGFVGRVLGDSTKKN